MPGPCRVLLTGESNHNFQNQHQGNSDTAMSTGLRLRPAVFTAREQLASGRAKLREQHDRGSPGIQVSLHLTDLLDTVVLGLYAASLADSDTQDMEAEMALVPIGGFGRRDVAPFSDVDLMLLATPAAGRTGRPTGEASDAEHLRRRPATGIQPADTRRSMRPGVEGRRPSSRRSWNPASWRATRGSTNGSWNGFGTRRGASGGRWSAAIVAARNDERHQYGETAYLLEPNIKRSRGGLRDVQSVRWIGFIRYGERELESLDQIGALPPADHRRLVQAHEFLLRLRNELHFHAGKSQDLLTRDEQVRLAELYGYQKLAGVLPVERFMRDFFEHSGDVRYVSVELPRRRAASPPD